MLGMSLFRKVPMRVAVGISSWRHYVYADRVRKKTLPDFNLINLIRQELRSTFLSEGAWADRLWAFSSQGGPGACSPEKILKFEFLNGWKFSAVPVVVYVYANKRLPGTFLRAQSGSFAVETGENTEFAFRCRNLPLSGPSTSPTGNTPKTRTSKANMERRRTLPPIWNSPRSAFRGNGMRRSEFHYIPHATSFPGWNIARCDWHNLFSKKLLASVCSVVLLPRHAEKSILHRSEMVVTLRIPCGRSARVHVLQLRGHG